MDFEANEMNSGIAVIRGFIEASFISFTKDYPAFYGKDESSKNAGTCSTPKPVLTYTGNFDWHNKAFAGKWEVIVNDPDNPFGAFLQASSGSWKMNKI